MTRINPNKLYLSKWTAVTPKNKEKHFIVVKLVKDENEAIVQCILESVFSKRQFILDWQDLKQEAHWLMGWK